MKKLAVFTLTYNRREYSERAIENLLSQDLPDIELSLFILDNASSDSTCDYLRELEKRDSRVTVCYGGENIGTAEGFKKLLREYTFGKGFDFIMKNDDDELLPNNWFTILDYWDELEANDIIIAGFKRPCTTDYFEGLKWVSRNPENETPLWFGDNETYVSYIAPGPQISTEQGWKSLIPALSDYGEKSGGWDVACAMRLQEIEKKCIVIYNKECHHFQVWEDHPEYTQNKFDEQSRVREQVNRIRNTKVLGLVQARMSSQRLPRKSLMEIAGKPLILWVLERVKRVKRIDEVVLVTSTDPSDDILAYVIQEKGFKVFRGSLNDVRDRFYQAAKQYEGDVIVRVTGDNPLVEPLLIDQMIHRTLIENNDYTACEDCIAGVGAEVFKRESFEKAIQLSDDNYSKEHVTPSFYQNENQFQTARVPVEDYLKRSDIRLTVDTQEDFELMSQLYASLLQGDFVDNKIVINELTKVLV